MLEEDFHKWQVTSIADDILDGPEMYITSLGYLDYEPSLFVKRPDGSIWKENKQLIGLNK